MATNGRIDSIHRDGLIRLLDLDSKDVTEWRRDMIAVHQHWEETGADPDDVTAEG